MNCTSDYHATTFMSDKHDSYICLICNVFLEEAWSDENCKFCYKRPSVSFTIKEHNHLLQRAITCNTADQEGWSAFLLQLGNE